MADAIVVGGGIAGLSCAVRLRAAGLDVELLEEAEEPGGNVRTIEEAGFRMERGPHTFMSSADHVFALAEAVGAGPDLVNADPASGVRYIARGGRLHELFSGPAGFARSGLLSWRGKLDLVTEPLRTRRGDPGESAAAFFDRRFGPEAAAVLAGAFVSGVYAGDPRTLSAPAAFPLFWRFEEESGGMIRGGIRHVMGRRRARKALGPAAPPRRTGLWSFSGGLGTLTRAAAGALGGSVALGCAALSIQREAGGWAVETAAKTLGAAHLVLALPPHRAAPLLDPIDAALARDVDGVRLAPLAAVHMGFRNRVPGVPDAFGFLVPRGEGVRTLGVLFPSRMFHDRTPAGGDLLTGFVGGVLDPAAIRLSDGDLLDTVLGDLGRLSGTIPGPDLVRILRYESAIPQLELGHLDRMGRVRAALGRLPGLALAGNWLGGVGMKEAASSGAAAARAVIAGTGHGHLQGSRAGE